MTNKGFMNRVEQQSLRWYGGTSFGYMPTSSVAVSWGRTIPNFQKTTTTTTTKPAKLFFKRGCKHVTSHQQWKSVPFAQYPCQHLLSLEILILPILTGARWIRRVLLIFISLRPEDFEHIGVSQPPEIPLLGILCLTLYPIFKLVCEFLTSWVLYIFWTLVLCQV